jgi:hypothetical protein
MYVSVLLGKPNINILHKGLYVIFLFLFFSCSKEIEIDTQGFKQQVVVNSIFCPGEPFIFDFSLTQTPTNAFTKINDSIYVSLYSDNKKILETKILADSLITNIYPQYECSYQLKVHIEGFDTVYACDTVPARADIVNTSFIGPTSIDKYGDQFAQYYIGISDPVQTKNYYELNWGYNYESKTTDPVLLNEGDLPYNPTTYFFSDELFNGQIYTMSINYGLPRGSKPSIAIRAASRNYYLYRKSLTRHLFTQPTRDMGVGAFIYKGEAQPMYTNIVNGVGIFAGYAETQPYYFQEITK